jgi:hypothetical protein
MQIDCEGFSFMGKPRRIEFVFRDDSLEMAWVMTPVEEREQIEKEITAAAGEPSKRTKNYRAYVDSRIALRLDNPEILFYSNKLAPIVDKWFDEP